MSEAVQPLLCPFCDGIPWVDCYHPHGPEMVPTHGKVYCVGSLCVANPSVTSDQGELKAINLWNTRPPLQAAAPDLLSALEASDAILAIVAAAAGEEGHCMVMRAQELTCKAIAAARGK